MVLDAEDAGWGCSTRNGGQVSTSVKPSFEELAALHGAERALAILQEGHTALAWIGEFIAAEKIDCDFGVVGRFHAAHNPAQYEALARGRSNQPKGLEVECHMVPRAEQRSESAPTPISAAPCSRAMRRWIRRFTITACWTASWPPGATVHRALPGQRHRAATAADFRLTTPRGDVAGARGDRRDQRLYRRR